MYGESKFRFLIPDLRSHSHEFDSHLGKSNKVFTVSFTHASRHSTISDAQPLSFVAKCEWGFIHNWELRKLSS